MSLLAPAFANVAAGVVLRVVVAMFVGSVVDRKTLWANTRLLKRPVRSDCKAFLYTSTPSLEPTLRLHPIQTKAPPLHTQDAHGMVYARGPLSSAFTSEFLCVFYARCHQ